MPAPYGFIAFTHETKHHLIRPESPIHGAAISPDGTTIAGQWVGGVRLWSDSSGKQLAELRGRGAEPCFAIAFSPDSKAILTGGPDGVVQSWEVGTGRPPGEAITYYTTVFAVAFSPDGRVVLTGAMTTRPACGTARPENLWAGPWNMMPRSTISRSVPMAR